MKRTTTFDYTNYTVKFLEGNDIGSDDMNLERVEITWMPSFPNKGYGADISLRSDWDYVRTAKGKVIEKDGKKERRYSWTPDSKRVDATGEIKRDEFGYQELNVILDKNYDAYCEALKEAGKIATLLNEGKSMVETMKMRKEERYTEGDEATRLRILSDEDEKRQATKSKREENKAKKEEAVK